ncbi:olfactory receptor 52D1-like [Genypterus blacodes]|uniref:olfactory receptor 52D1-like n=1 Tax=Genypterus blacodes TaxID=154954 RepID=UPI003F777284
MDNSSLLTLTMPLYAVMENYKHFQFVAFLLVYSVIMILNVQMIYVICHNKDLQLPMNVFACVLLINEMYGSTASLPATMSVLLSETYEITVKWCKAQIFFLHTYGSAEFCILAVMGYDRYVAICYPLHYHTIMCTSRVSKLVALVCIYPVVVFTSFFSLTLQQKVCVQIMPKLYCVNMELVKNSCANIAYISTVGLIILILFVGPQLLMIVFSYVHIFRVCRKLPKKSQVKALKTCIPHLLSLANYTIGTFFEIISSRFNMSYIAQEARIFMSLYFIIVPPIANPLLYGLGTQVIRVHILRIFVKYMNLSAKRSKAVVAA